MMCRVLGYIFRGTLVIFIGCMWLVHVYVSERSINKAAFEINSELSHVYLHSILKKYTPLLRKVPTHVGSDPYHMNLSIKMRAEFIQALSGFEGVSLVLYNPDGMVMFTVTEDEDKELDDVAPLEPEQLEILKSGGSIGKKVAGGVYSLTSPVLSDTGEPVVYLHITNDCSALAGFLSMINLLYLVVPGLLVAWSIGITFVMYRKNTRLLNSQYDANLELKEKKENAEKESISKSQFLANVSHELRTPLNSIIGFSEIIQGEELGPIGNEQYKEYVKDIHHAGVHLLSLINDILDFSKAEANKLTIDLVKCDLKKIVESCFNMMLIKAQEAEIDLRQAMPAHSIVIKADARRMKQVLLNMLSNSIKFTPKNGFVKLSVEVKKDTVIIEIVDSGIGIAREDMYKVMSVFGQADSEHSRQYEGTGLGLPLSRKLVELMNGTFDIKSEPDIGTVITLTFPCLAERSSGDHAF